MIQNDEGPITERIVRPRSGRPFAARYAGFCPLCRRGFERGDMVARLERPVRLNIEGDHGRRYLKPYKYAHVGCTIAGEPKLEPKSAADNICSLCGRSHLVGGEIILFCEDVLEEASK